MSGKREIKFESTEKYLRKLDGDLAGRVFHLAMDNGEEYELHFVTGDIVEYRAEDGTMHWEKYGCLKAAEGTWFVASILGGAPVRTCITLVIDEPQSLVTMAISRMGVYPLRPRLALVDFVFGAIRVPNQPLPVKRHGFSRELAGKKLNWHYSTGFINTQIYPSERFCRIRPMTDTRTPEEIEKERRDIELGLIPKPMLYDEPMRVIRIKDGMYLISFIEENMNKVNPLAGGNNLMILTNLDEGFDCGRTFSMNREQKPEHGLFRAYGDFLEEDIPLEHEPTPYRV